MDVLPHHSALSLRNSNKPRLLVWACRRSPAVGLASLLLLTIGMHRDAAGQLTDPSTANQTEDTQPVPPSPEDDQPYIVFVASHDRFARCGPGEQHYRTEPLRVGQELEVYMETSDGWLGIRPLQESFCWLPADAVDVNEDGLNATVTEDKTVAWIGTNLGQAKRYSWQVQLAAGEQVAILAQTKRDTGEGVKHWLRIAPPSGEFRWVHSDDVVESAERLATVLAQKNNTDPAQPRVAKSESKKSAAAEVDGVVPIPAKQIRQTTATDAMTSDTSQPKSVLVASKGSEATSDGLRNTDEIPSLQPAPNASRKSSRRSVKNRLSASHDSPIQIHRGIDPNEFEDRGAVIGSGLRADWQGQSDETDTPLVDDTNALAAGEVINDGQSETGAAAAASAIAEPFRRVTDVVANFISPPRLVQIDPTRSETLGPLTASDRRWMVGSDRKPTTSASPGGSALSALPTSLAGRSADRPSGDTSTGLGMPIAQAGGTFQGKHPANRPSRVVPVANIARVEDAVVDADLDAATHVLSKLMAEQASADEMDPLIRRIEALLQSGDVTQASRTREMLQRAESYRNLAARRDGTTIVRSSVSETTGNEPVRPLRQSDNGNDTVRSKETAGTLSSSPTHMMLQQTTAAPANAISPVTHTAPLESPAGTATGYLVQVYSSRANSPPYALTDDRGLTVAYVTPYPGVNLRNHLNSRIEVSGQEKLLEGMSTPHLLVDQAIRR